MKKILPLLIILAIALISCTANVADPSDYNENTWEGLFKQYWTVMEEDYVHFSRNDLDWDAKYDEYLPKFQSLSYNKEKDSFTAFRLFKEMAKDVNDYHYSLSVTDNFGNILKFNPALEKKWIDKNPGEDINTLADVSVNGTGYANAKGETLSEDDRKNFLREAVEGIFEVEDLGVSFHNGETGFIQDTIKKGSISDYEDVYGKDAAWNNFINVLGISKLSYFFGVTNDDIAYFHISAFPTPAVLSTPREKKNGEMIWDPIYEISYASYYNMLSTEQKGSIDGFSAGLSTVIFQYLNSIGKSNKVGEHEVKGMIFDVRSNGGGALDFLDMLFANFFKEDKVIGYKRYKCGYGEYDYTPWTEMMLTSPFGVKNPLGDVIRPDHDYDKPFAILTNEYSVSCSELSTMTVKFLMKNGKQFGITTFGGTCALTDRNIFQSGPYTNENKNLSVYTTTFQFKDVNGNSWESIGLTPDVQVKLNTDRDDVFAEAIKWINNFSN